MIVFKSILRRTSSVKSICILFITSHLVLLSMMKFTFPLINKQIGTKAFDLQTFGYSASEAESIVSNLNSEATQIYLFPQLTFLDLFYPLLLALLLSSILFRFVNTGSKMGLLIVLIPFLGMTFDYLENIFVILLITKLVGVSEAIVLMSSSFTVLKSIFTTISWIVILGYSIRWLILLISKKISKLSFM